MPADKTLLDLELPSRESVFNEAELAAVAFLARYSGRTLDAYRHDLRGYFSWAADAAIEVLAATRPHVELYRHHMEQRGLAAATIDRRLSTVCGFYRFAHIDGRITSNPAQYVRRPKVHRSEGRGLDRGVDIDRRCMRHADRSCNHQRACRDRDHRRDPLPR